VPEAIWAIIGITIVLWAVSKVVTVSLALRTVRPLLSKIINDRITGGRRNG